MDLEKCIENVVESSNRVMSVAVHLKDCALINNGKVEVSIWDFLQLVVAFHDSNQLLIAIAEKLNK